MSDVDPAIGPDAALKNALQRMLALLESAPRYMRDRNWQDAWREAQNAMLTALQDYGF